MRRAPLLTGLFFALFLVFVFSGSLALFLTDWMWFRSVGHEGVFWGALAIRASSGIGVGLLGALLIFANALWAVGHTHERTLVLPAEFKLTRFGQWVARISLARIALALSLFFGLVIGLAASVWWRDLLLFFNRGDFGYVDPIFNRDASFYIFTLPILNHLRGLLWGIGILSMLMCLGIYAARGALTLTFFHAEGRYVPKGLAAGNAARRHLAFLAAFLVAVMAAGSYLRRFGLMYDQRELLAGPGYADVFGTLPLLSLQAICTFAAAILVFLGIDRLRRSFLVLAGGLFFASFGLTVVYPGLVQKFSVVPNEFNRESKYIENHIKATRFAFGLDKVEERRLSGNARLTRADITANSATVNSIRLWDHAPLLATFSQVQEIRTYYEFRSVDNDRYVIDGELRQTMLSPRELLVTSLPVEARSWVNETMTYTHGYGVALGPVNQVTEQGLPELFVKDLPPKVTHPELAITRPELYFGEYMTNPVIVKTNNKEFDFPSGERAEYTTYAGTGGIPIGGLLSRILFAIRLGNMKILLSSDLTSESEIMIYRTIAERARRIAPFLTYDRDPYLVLADGRLVWIMDAYTRSEQFPYAARVRGVGSYLRNSVKVTIDAYDGSIQFYLVDTTDPIASAWGKAFPGLMRPIEEMPPSLRAHIRYPEDLFTIQTSLYATFHMEQAESFYKREDQWEIPAAEGDKLMVPYYTIMRLPGEKGGDEFIQMLPFTPKNKPNLAAWMVARSDPAHYGGLIIYKFPNDEQFYGPRQVSARINQDVSISQQVSLWNQQGSKVVWGTLLVIPIEESLIYVQPLYLRADAGGIPELKRVIIGYGNQIVMEPTLEGALGKLFGGAAPQPAVGAAGAAGSTGAAPALALPGQPQPSASPEWQALAREARTHYDAANEASRSGDWSRYGDEIKKLGKALEELNKTANPAAAPTPAKP